MNYLQGAGVLPHDYLADIWLLSFILLCAPQAAFWQATTCLAGD